MEENVLNNVGAITQPFLTPFVRELSTILHTWLHAIMILPHHCYESEWTAKFGDDFPVSITTNHVESFGKVVKLHVYIYLLFFAFLLVALLWRSWMLHLCVFWIQNRLSAISPVWSTWSRWTFRRLNKIVVSIFPAIDRRKMPLYGCHRLEDFLNLLVWVYILKFLWRERGGVVVSSVGLRIKRSWVRSPQAAPCYVLEQDTIINNH